MGLSHKQISFAMRAFILPAWRRAVRLAGEAGETIDATDAGFTDWRHAEIMVAVGKDGLTRCENEEFADICAHFADLAGHPDQALEWHLRAGGDRRRRIEFSLNAAMQRFGLSIPYAQSICRDQFRCQVEDASDVQLVNLIRTITARGRSKRDFSTR